MFENVCNELFNMDHPVMGDGRSFTRMTEQHEGSVLDTAKHLFSFTEWTEIHSEIYALMN